MKVSFGGRVGTDQVFIRVTRTDPDKNADPVTLDPDMTLIFCPTLCSGSLSLFLLTVTNQSRTKESYNRNDQILKHSSVNVGVKVVQ